MMKEFFRLKIFISFDACCSAFISAVTPDILLSTSLEMILLHETLSAANLLISSNFSHMHPPCDQVYHQYGLFGVFQISDQPHISYF